MSDLKIIRGDDVTFDVDVTLDGAPVEVESALALTFTAKRSARDADVDALIRKDLDGGVTVDDDGIHVTIDAGDTAGLAAPLALIWDLEFVDADGLTHTVAGGYLRVDADVTLSSGLGSGS